MRVEGEEAQVISCKNRKFAVERQSEASCKKQEKCREKPD